MSTDMGTTTSTDFTMNAEPRDAKGKVASRRLRREGRIPAILYGGDKEPETLSLEHRAVAKQLENEGFYSHILTVKIGDRSESAILRDMQRHPFKPFITHMDFQRISADEKIRVNVPLHFMNENKAPGVVDEGGIIGHLLNDVEITCFPKDLPEFIEVDVANLGMNEAIHLSQIKLPEGVEIVQLTHGEEYDATVVNIHHARLVEEEEELEGEGEEREELTREEDEGDEDND